MHVAISKHCFQVIVQTGFNMDEFVMINEHEEIEMLLPWYVTGQLDAAEKAQVDAHIAGCADCRLLLAEEWALKAKIASLPTVVPEFKLPRGSENDRSTIASHAWQSTRQTVSRWAAKPLRVAAFAAAQAAMLLIVFQLAQLTTEPTAPYRTLSSGEAAIKANAIVMFDANTREAEFRKILIDTNSIIVGGPTESNVYYLHIEPSVRNITLESFRANSMILLAQPIDAE